MKVHPTSSRVVLITGVIYALIGLVLVAGGAWLLALGGSAFYVIVGLGSWSPAASWLPDSARLYGSMPRS